jgi:hypothetical protein
MPPCVLYQRLCLQFLQCAPSLGVWPRRRLALLVTGLLLARHTALPRLAAQLRRVIRTAHADSIERRLRRTLAATDFETSHVFERVVRASLRNLAPGHYLVLLDDTQQTTRCTLSTLALAYRGRALPLAQDSSNRTTVALEDARSARYPSKRYDGSRRAAKFCEVLVNWQAFRATCRRLTELNAAASSYTDSWVTHPEKPGHCC